MSSARDSSSISRRTSPSARRHEFACAKAPPIVGVLCSDDGQTHALRTFAPGSRPHDEWVVAKALPPQENSACGSRQGDIGGWRRARGKAGRLSQCVRSSPPVDAPLVSSLPLRVDSPLRTKPRRGPDLPLGRPSSARLFWTVIRFARFPHASGELDLLVGPRLFGFDGTLEAFAASPVVFRVLRIEMPE